MVVYAGELMSMDSLFEIINLPNSGWTVVGGKAFSGLIGVGHSISSGYALENSIILNVRGARHSFYGRTVTTVRRVSEYEIRIYGPFAIECENAKADGGGKHLVEFECVILKLVNFPIKRLIMDEKRRKHAEKQKQEAEEAQTQRFMDRDRFEDELENLFNGKLYINFGNDGLCFLDADGKGMILIKPHQDADGKSWITINDKRLSDYIF